MIALLTLLLSTVTWVAGAHAAGAASEAPVLNVVTEETIHTAVIDYVLEQLQDRTDEGERLEIKPRWQGDILLEKVGRVDLRVHRMSTRPLRGPTMLRVELIVDAETQKALTVTVDARFFRPVLVTTRSIRRGTVLADDGAVELVERDVTSARHGYFTNLDELLGLRARRPVGFGVVVSHRHVEEIPVIQRGDDVEMRVTSANMQMSTAGVALQDGAIGARIRVKNVASGKVLYGKVVDAATVQVGGEQS